MIIPNPVPSKKPTTVSYTVTPICFIKSLELRFVKVSHILLGWLIIKLSIIDWLVSPIQQEILLIWQFVLTIPYIVYIFYFLNIVFFLLKLVVYSSTPSSFHKVLKYWLKVGFSLQLIGFLFSISNSIL